MLSHPTSIVVVVALVVLVEVEVDDIDVVLDCWNTVWFMALVPKLNPSTICLALAIAIYVVATRDATISSTNSTVLAYMIKPVCFFR